jgi:hypothetical protein
VLLLLLLLVVVVVLSCWEAAEPDQLPVAKVPLQDLTATTTVKVRLTERQQQQQQQQGACWPEA